MSDLTPKQELFCHEYPKDFNATQAAIRAGYAEKAAAAMGAENLRKPKIWQRLTAVVRARCEKADLDIDWVLLRTMAIANAKLTDVASWDAFGSVTLAPTDELTAETKRALKKVKTTVREIPRKDADPIRLTTTEVTMHDPKPMLELLARYLKMFYGDAIVEEHVKGPILIALPEKQPLPPNPHLKH